MTLFLERRVGEKIVINGGAVIIEVVDMKFGADGRKKVRLKFEYSPPHTVFREEIASGGGGGRGGPRRLDSATVRERARALMEGAGRVEEEG